MTEYLSRTALLLGEDAMRCLAGARIAVIGLGGVGCGAAEALCRAGVGHLLLVDHDSVDITNLNRQIFYTTKHVGQKKAQVSAAHLSEINPQAEISPLECFCLPDTVGEIFAWRPDFIVDAIDTMTAKLCLAEECQKRGVGLVASLGTGNRLDPSRLRLGDVSETSGSGCPLARVMRRELKRRGVAALRVLFSTEEPLHVVASAENGRHSPGSCAFVPPVAGYLIAHDVVCSLLAAPNAPK